MPHHTHTPADLPGTRVRDHRLARGLTQEQLAEHAGLSLGVVKKIEQGGNGRLETYHALARALRVRTSALFEPGGPHLTRRPDDGAIDLMPLRQAVCPPFTLHGPLRADTVETEPDLRQLWRTARRVDQSYHQDDYVRVSELLPALLRSAHTAVAHFDNGPENNEALKLRSDVLQQAGRYLTQVRAYDLAHLALRDAMRDAAEAGDRLSSAAAVYLQGWTLIRQGRLDEAEQLAIATADDIEPRISRASRDELGVWGRLLVKASGAAARNNRSAEAREILRLARTAGAAIGGGNAGELYRCGKFGASSVGFQAIENHMVADRPTRVLGLAARVQAGTASTSNTHHRHLLDVARAHVMLRQGDEATGILSSLLDGAPDWLRQQQMAADTFQDVLRLSKRRITAPQRELAAFFEVA